MITIGANMSDPRKRSMRGDQKIAVSGRILQHQPPSRDRRGRIRIEPESQAGIIELKQQADHVTVKGHLLSGIFKHIGGMSGRMTGRRLRSKPREKYSCAIEGL